MNGRSGRLVRRSFFDCIRERISFVIVYDDSRTFTFREKVTKKNPCTHRENVTFTNNCYAREKIKQKSKKNEMNPSTKPWLAMVSERFKNGVLFLSSYLHARVRTIRIS